VIRIGRPYTLDMDSNQLFGKIEKQINFMGIILFFQLVPRNKNYAQISSKQGREGNKKN